MRNAKKYTACFLALLLGVGDFTLLPPTQAKAEATNLVQLSTSGLNNIGSSSSYSSSSTTKLHSHTLIHPFESNLLDDFGSAGTENDISTLSPTSVTESQETLTTNAPLLLPASDYQINGNSFGWQDAELTTDGDVLKITANDSPSAPIFIHVTAPIDSTITLRGKPNVVYSNVYVQVDQPITLRLDDFSIVAPAGDNFNGIIFDKTGSTDNVTLDLSGSNMIEGFDGIRVKSNEQVTITGSGSLTVKGRASDTLGADSGHGFHLMSDSSGTTQPGASLIMDMTGSVKAVGGDSSGGSGGNGIFLDWGNMSVKKGSVTAIGGNTEGDRTNLSTGNVTRRGGRGIQLIGDNFPQPSGILTIEGGQVEARGGQAQAVAPGSDYFEGGKGIEADKGVYIQGGTLQAFGGDSVNGIGGHAIQSRNVLEIGGLTTVVNATGGKGTTTAGSGVGFFVTSDIAISGATVTVTGGDGVAAEYGIYSPSGALTVSGGAKLVASGGQGMTATSNATGGPAIYVNGKVDILGSGVQATGGNGPLNGAHGIFSMNGQILISTDASVTALGGNGTTGVGGAGLRAFGGGDGNQVTIAPDAKDVYVRGGQGATEVRPSILAKDVFIASGNVEKIAMEGTNLRSIRNKVGGDDLYRFAVSKNPAAAGTVSAEVTGELGGNYTYRAPTQSDGKAYLWLPAGNQTAKSAGYRNKTAEVTDLDEASAVLDASSNNASLVSVAGQTSAIIGGGDGSTPNAAVTWTVSVPNSKETIKLTDMTAAAGTIVQGYTDSSFSNEMAAGGQITLAAGGSTTVYLKVTAEDGLTVKYYTVTVKREAGSVTPTNPSTGGTAPSSGTTQSPGTQPAGGFDIYVNGKAESAGKVTVTGTNDRTVTTVEVDPQKLEAKLAAEGTNAVVTVVLNKPSDAWIVQLPGGTIEKMVQGQASLEVQAVGASYRIPAEQIDLTKLASELGTDRTQDVKVEIRIADAGTEGQKLARQAEASGDFTVIATPFEFGVYAVYGDRTAELRDYSAYVERTIAVPAGVDPNKITTGVVLEADGSVRHVPTRVTRQGEQYTAEINSLTNSIYSLVWHPMEFADVANHWSREAVNDMGSRMVVEGTGLNRFEPNRDISRAEFASMLVKGLGLRPQQAQVLKFSDVSADAWYADAIQTAYAYGVLSGYADGTYRPEAKISRQEALILIANAMKITGLSDQLSSVNGALDRYEDRMEVASSAYPAIEACIEAGLVTGRSSATLAPLANMTRAEAAALVQRLLQKSGLI